MPDTYGKPVGDGVKLSTKPPSLADDMAPVKDDTNRNQTGAATPTKLVGTIIETADSGQRLVLQGAQLSLFSGDTYEYAAGFLAPSYVNPGGAGFIPTVELSSPIAKDGSGGFRDQASITLSGQSADGTTNPKPNVDVSGDLLLEGRISSNATTVDSGFFFRDGTNGTQVRIWAEVQGGHTNLYAKHGSDASVLIAHLT